MEKKKIDFVSAAHSGINVYAGVGNLKGWACTAKGLAYTLKTVGLADHVFASSNIDFASEEGFENDDDAAKLWDAAIGIYNWEVNGVA